jgi:S1-C subfamily serine protease
MLIRLFRTRLRRARTGLIAGFALGSVAGLASPADAQESGDALDAVVEVNAVIPGNARTADSLGTSREGSGIVIDDSGLIVTIGYLILEAAEVTVRAPGAPQPIAASIVAYDHESGFGLLRTSRPLDVAPMPLGSSSGLQPMQPLLAVSRVGTLEPMGVYVVDRREFAGYWEYLLDEAIFTSPPHAQFVGAALVDEDGRLVGIGSLFVADAAVGNRPVPGNMFIPIDYLKPIMGDLLARGRRADPPRPWLGISLEEHRGRLFVTRVSPGSPAAGVGIEPDDLVLGIGGAPVEGLADFYRKLWSRGKAGVEVPLDILKGVEVRSMPVRTADRYRYLRLNPSY